MGCSSEWITKGETKTIQNTSVYMLSVWCTEKQIFPVITTPWNEVINLPGTVGTIDTLTNPSNSSEYITVKMVDVWCTTSGDAGKIEICHTEPATTGRIYCKTTPNEANIYYDDKLMDGLTNRYLTNVPVGSHTVKFTKDGYDDAIVTVDVSAGGTANAIKTLLVEPHKLTIISNIEGAQVFYEDGNAGYNTPYTYYLVPGTYSFTLKADGREDNTVSVVMSTEDKILTIAGGPLIAPSTGSIYCKTVPDDAKIYYDDKLMDGLTNRTLTNVPVGNHTIEFTKDGYDAARLTVEVSANTTSTVSKTLVSTASTTHKLTIDSNIEGALIYVGSTSIRWNAPHTFDLAPGTYSFTIKADGREDNTESVVMSTSDKSVTINAGELIAPLTGSIYCKTTPDDAKIYYDNRLQNGLTNRTLTNVPVGSHSIMFTKDGYRDAFVNVTVSAGNTANAIRTLGVKYYKLTIISNIEDAKVFYGDGTTGYNTPYTYYLVPGTYSFTLKADGREDNTQSVVMSTEDKIVTIAGGELIAPLTGSIYCKTTPDGAKIYYDNRLQNVLTNRTLTNVPVGSHSIMFTKDGYDDAFVNVTVSAGNTANAIETLEIKYYELTIDSNVTGAEVFYGDGNAGYNTPFTYSLIPGTYSFTIKADGRSDNTESVIMSASDKSVTINAGDLLEKLDTTLTLNNLNRVLVPGMTVTLSGRLVDSNDDPVVNAEIKFKDEDFLFDSNVGVTATTGPAGLYAVNWIVEDLDWITTDLELYAIFDGNVTHNESQSDIINVEAGGVPTQLTLITQSSGVTEGDKITITGKLTADNDNDMVGRTIEFYDYDTLLKDKQLTENDNPLTVKTTSGGNYTVEWTVKSIDLWNWKLGFGSVTMRARFNESEMDGVGYDKSVSEVKFIDISSPKKTTVVTLYQIASNIELGDKVILEGYLKTDDGDPISNQQISFLYGYAYNEQPLPVGTLPRTDNDGKFSVEWTVTGDLGGIIIYSKYTETETSDYKSSKSQSIMSTIVESLPEIENSITVDVTNRVAGKEYEITVYNPVSRFWSDKYDLGVKIASRWCRNDDCEIVFTEEDNLIANEYYYITALKIPPLSVLAEERIKFIDNKTIERSTQANSALLIKICEMLGVADCDTFVGMLTLDLMSPLIDLMTIIEGTDPYTNEPIPDTTWYYLFAILGIIPMVGWIPKQVGNLSISLKGIELANIARKTPAFMTELLKEGVLYKIINFTTQQVDELLRLAKKGPDFIADFIKYIDDAVIHVPDNYETTMSGNLLSGELPDNTINAMMAMVRSVDEIGNVFDFSVEGFNIYDLAMTNPVLMDALTNNRFIKKALVMDQSTIYKIIEFANQNNISELVKLIQASPDPSGIITLSEAWRKGAKIVFDLSDRFDPNGVKPELFIKLRKSADLPSNMVNFWNDIFIKGQVYNEAAFVTQDPTHIAQEIIAYSIEDINQLLIFDDIIGSDFKALLNVLSNGTNGEQELAELLFMTRLLQSGTTNPIPESMIANWLNDYARIVYKSFNTGVKEERITKKTEIIDSILDQYTLTDEFVEMLDIGFDTPLPEWLNKYDELFASIKDPTTEIPIESLIEMMNDFMNATPDEIFNFFETGMQMRLMDRLIKYGNTDTQIFYEFIRSLNELNLTVASKVDKIAIANDVIDAMKIFKQNAEVENAQQIFFDLFINGRIKPYYEIIKAKWFKSLSELNYPQSSDFVEQYRPLFKQITRKELTQIDIGSMNDILSKLVTNPDDLKSLLNTVFETDLIDGLKTFSGNDEKIFAEGMDILRAASKSNISLEEYRAIVKDIANMTKRYLAESDKVSALNAIKAIKLKVVSGDYLTSIANLELEGWAIELLKLTSDASDFVTQYRGTLQGVLSGTITNIPKSTFDALIDMGITNPSELIELLKTTNTTQLISILHGLNASSDKVLGNLFKIIVATSDLNDLKRFPLIQDVTRATLKYENNVINSNLLVQSLLDGAILRPIEELIKSPWITTLSNIAPDIPFNIAESSAVLKRIQLDEIPEIDKYTAQQIIVTIGNDPDQLMLLLRTIDDTAVFNKIINTETQHGKIFAQYFKILQKIDINNTSYDLFRAILIDVSTEMNRLLDVDDYSTPLLKMYDEIFDATGSIKTIDELKTADWAHQIETLSTIVPGNLSDLTSLLKQIINGTETQLSDEAINAILGAGAQNIDDVMQLFDSVNTPALITKLDNATDLNIIILREYARMVHTGKKLLPTDTLMKEILQYATAATIRAKPGNESDKLLEIFSILYVSGEQMQPIHKIMRAGYFVDLRNMARELGVLTHPSGILGKVRQFKEESIILIYNFIKKTPGLKIYVGDRSFLGWWFLVDNVPFFIWVLVGAFGNQAVKWEMRPPIENLENAYTNLMWDCRNNNGVNKDALMNTVNETAITYEHEIESWWRQLMLSDTDITIMEQTLQTAFDGMRAELDKGCGETQFDSFEYNRLADNAKDAAYALRAACSAESVQQMETAIEIWDAQKLAFITYAEKFTSEVAELGESYNNILLVIENDRTIAEECLAKLESGEPEDGIFNPKQGEEGTIRDRLSSYSYDIDSACKLKNISMVNILLNEMTNDLVLYTAYLEDNKTELGATYYDTVIGWVSFYTNQLNLFKTFDCTTGEETGSGDYTTQVGEKTIRDRLKNYTFSINTACQLGNVTSVNESLENMADDLELYVAYLEDNKTELGEIYYNAVIDGVQTFTNDLALYNTYNCGTSTDPEDESNNGDYTTQNEEKIIRNRMDGYSYNINTACRLKNITIVESLLNAYAADLELYIAFLEDNKTELGTIYYNTVIGNVTASTNDLVLLNLLDCTTSEETGSGDYNTKQGESIIRSRLNGYSYNIYTACDMNNVSSVNQYLTMYADDLELYTAYLENNKTALGTVYYNTVIGGVTLFTNELAVLKLINCTENGGTGGSTGGEEWTEPTYNTSQSQEKIIRTRLNGYSYNIRTACNLYNTSIVESLLAEYADDLILYSAFLENNRMSLGVEYYNTVIGGVQTFTTDLALLNTLDCTESASEDPGWVTPESNYEIQQQEYLLRKSLESFKYQLNIAYNLSELSTDSLSSTIKYTDETTSLYDNLLVQFETKIEEYATFLEENKNALGERYVFGITTALVEFNNDLELAIARKNSSSGSSGESSGESSGGYNAYAQEARDKASTLTSLAFIINDECTAGNSAIVTILLDQFKTGMDAYTEYIDTNQTNLGQSYSTALFQHSLFTTQYLLFLERDCNAEIELGFMINGFESRLDTAKWATNNACTHGELAILRQQLEFTESELALLQTFTTDNAEQLINERYLDTAHSIYNLYRIEYENSLNCLPTMPDIPENGIFTNVYVSEIIDGDSIVVRTGGKEFNVRLVGINAPEYPSGGVSAIQCTNGAPGDNTINKNYYYAATNIMKDLALKESPELNELHVDPNNSTSYDRILGVLYINGNDVNKEMITRGAACHWAVQENTVVNDTQYAAEQAEAKANNRGIWADFALVEYGSAIFKAHTTLKDGSVSAGTTAASIYINETYAYSTSSSINRSFAPGTFSVTFAKPGYESITKEFTIKTGVTSEVTAIFGDAGSLEGSEPDGWETYTPSTPKTSRPSSGYVPSTYQMPTYETKQPQLPDKVQKDPWELLKGEFKIAFVSIGDRLVKHSEIIKEVERYMTKHCDLDLNYTSIKLPFIEPEEEDGCAILDDPDYIEENIESVKLEDEEYDIIYLLWNAGDATCTNYSGFTGSIEETVFDAMLCTSPISKVDPKFSSTVGKKVDMALKINYNGSLTMITQLTEALHEIYHATKDTDSPELPELDEEYCGNNFVNDKPNSKCIVNWLTEFNEALPEDITNVKTTNTESNTG